MGREQTSVEESLDERLARLGQSDLAPFARKLNDMLAGIRADFVGETRERLEREVAATLDRQLALREGRIQTAQALSELMTRQRELIETLYGMYLKAAPDDGTRH